MAIDFDRAAGDYIYQSAGAIPMPPHSSMMECWFQLDPWGTPISVTSGHLMGLYEMGGNLHMMALMVEEDSTVFPTLYYLRFMIVNAAGTFSASAALTYVANKWHHALGVWQGGGVQNIYCFLDGVLGGTTSASTGALAGATFYAFGADFRVWPAANIFNGRIAEAAAWATGPPATMWYVPSMCKGLNPIDRDPFTYGPQLLRSWTQMHNTTVHDIMRPAAASAAWTVNGAVTYADHPPVFEAARNEHYPRPPLAVATDRYYGVSMTPNMMIG